MKAMGKPQSNTNNLHNIHPKAIDSVSFVFTTRTTCGKKANVVKIAAMLPIIFILLCLLKKLGIRPAS